MKNLLTCLSVSLLLAACLDTSEAPAVPDQELPEDVNTWLYVASGVASEGATGTALKPFPSVQMAIDAASAGDGILIEAGTFEGPLSIDKDLVLTGLPTASQEVILDGGDADLLLQISGDAVVRVEDLELRGGHEAAVQITGSGVRARLNQVKVTCVDPEELKSGGAGHGLVIENGADVEVNGGALSGCAGYGVFADQSKLVMDQSARLNNHQQGGVRLEAALDGSEIRSAMIENNRGFGIGLFCGTLNIVNCTISDTTNPGGGDGVVASALTGLAEDDPRLGCETVLMVGGEETQGNMIQSNQRAGILVDGDVSALIQNNDLVNNGNGGIWVVGQDEGNERFTDIVQNVVEENRHVGIGIVNQAQTEVKGNEIRDTLPIDDFSGETSHGDGVFVELAESLVYGNNLRRNVRYGILMRSPAVGSCIGDDNYFEENMQAHKWEHSAAALNACEFSWFDDSDFEVSEPPEGGGCTEEERRRDECPDNVPIKMDEAPELTCESPSCILNDPTVTGCPPDCDDKVGKRENPNAYASSEAPLDCTGCYVDGGPPCPNDDYPEGQGPCCKPNSVDGLDVNTESSATD
ncbi:MAG: hypothetical protein CL940_06010 [Deltaproteobacteria bacterium]|nr:hypothetical protein [Deltaproteobacteria bacterium]